MCKHDVQELQRALDGADPRQLEAKPLQDRVARRDLGGRRDQAAVLLGLASAATGPGGRGGAWADCGSWGGAQSTALAGVGECGVRALSGIKTGVRRGVPCGIACGAPVAPQRPGRA